MSELHDEEHDPRAPLQAGDEGGTIDQPSGSDGGNDPTPDEGQLPPPWDEGPLPPQ